MGTGYDSPLYVLPFDHRATFSKTMFGWEGPLSTEQTAQITSIKEVIYDAFKAAVAGGVPKERAGILVDETFGASILRDAAKQGFITACPAEKSGRKSSILSTAPNSLATSRNSTRPSVRSWCATTPTETMGSTGTGRPTEAIV